MKLEDFVSATLTQIAKGVETAVGEGVDVPPVSMSPDSTSYVYDRRDGRGAQMVEFDVAITTMEESKKGGGIGVFVGPVGIGTRGETESTNSSVSRIRFSVPIQLAGSDEVARSPVKRL